MIKMQRWEKLFLTLSAFLLFDIIFVNSQDYFGYGQYPSSMFGSSGPYGASMYEDNLPYLRPMRRSFGQPNSYANSHDSFDQEKTMDERISAKMNPLPYLFNPGVRQGITTLQQMEAKKQQMPTRKLFPSFF